MNVEQPLSSRSATPSFTRVEMTGSPGEVDRLVTVLSGASEIVSDSRSEPDARGEVTSITEVVAHPGPTGVPEAPATAKVTLQVVLEVDLSVWADQSASETSRQLEEDSARLMRAVPGSSNVQTRVVSSRPARAPQP